MTRRKRTSRIWKNSVVRWRTAITARYAVCSSTTLPRPSAGCAPGALASNACRAPSCALVRPFMMRSITTALGLSPELLHAGAILVNEQGIRFADECDRADHATSRQPRGRAWVVFDGDIAARFNKWPNFVSTAPGVAHAYLDDAGRNAAQTCSPRRAS